MSFIRELKRRGVMRVTVAYVVVSWLLIQVADIMLDAFEAPGWLFRAFIILLAIGLPVAMVVSWFFEFTARGLVRESRLEPGMDSGRAVRRSLNVVVISILAAAVALFALDRFWWRGVSPDPAEADGHGDTASVAVLPFVNRSSLEEDAYFADGIHDELLTTLAKIGSLRVTSRTSVMRYRDGAVSIPEIGRELGVGSVLEGGVQRAGRQVRINAQLIDASTDEHLWAESFDREISTDNLFSIQSEITRSIADALEAQLTREEIERLERHPTEDLEAYEAYLRGRADLLDFSLPALDAAVASFTQATELDGDFAGAWAGLCEAWLGKYIVGSDTAHFEAAQAACEQALDLDAEAVEVNVALARLYRHHGEYALAETEARRALTLDPDNIDGLIELGTTLALESKNREAEFALLKAASLQPAYWPAHNALFKFYRSHDQAPGNLQRSVRHAIRVVELQPEVASAWNNLGTAYQGLQQYDAAKSAWDRALELEPTRTGYTNRGLQYYYEGHFDDAAEMQREAVELAPHDHRAWGRLAESLRHLGGEDARSAQAYETAIRLAQERLQVNEMDWQTGALLAVYYAFAGEPERARSQIREAISVAGRGAEVLLYAALVAYATGDRESALALAEEVVAADAAYRWYVVNDPDLIGLKDEPRFRAMASE